MNTKAEREESQLERVQRVRRELAEKGPPHVRQAGDFEKVAFPARDADLLRDLLVAEKIETVIEIGLAYGSSALAIGEALISIGAKSPRHLIIDPFQESAFANAGWGVLEAAGLRALAQLISQPSSIALPRLVEQGATADAAFVDGSHRFHEVFIDLYFLRKIVRPGGLVVLDDYSWPSVRTAARYFENNMGWRSVPRAFVTGSLDEAIKEPRVRALRLPDPAFEPPFDQLIPF